MSKYKKKGCLYPILEVIIPPKQDVLGGILSNFQFSQWRNGEMCVEIVNWISCGYLLTYNFKRDGYGWHVIDVAGAAHSHCIDKETEFCLYNRRRYDKEGIRRHKYPEWMNYDDTFFCRQTTTTKFSESEQSITSTHSASH